jgi:hypothetical protein
MSPRNLARKNWPLMSHPRTSEIMTPMNRNLIARLHEGKVLDALIAELLLGWSRVSRSDNLWITRRRQIALLPRFSTNPAYLQDIHAKLHRRGWGLQWTPCLRHGHGADFFKNGKRIVGFGKSPSLALCQAALLIWLSEETSSNT